MAEADRLTIASGIPGFRLMDHAGTAVAKAAARLLTARHPHGNKSPSFAAPATMAAMGLSLRLLCKRKDLRFRSGCSVRAPI